MVHVWESASKTGDTKTPKSKRSLVLPKRAVNTLKAHKIRQDREREAAVADAAAIVSYQHAYELVMLHGEPLAE